ncbi:MAG TPA: hypothetical protein VGK84_02785, partial [Candidatus Tumulicola sp.]
MTLAIATSLLAVTVAAASPSPAASVSPTPIASATPGVADPCSSLISIVNRPSFGTGVCTVRTGHFDLENGYTNLATDGGTNVVSYPQSLLRIGTFDPHLDFEVGPVTENHSSAAGAPVNGMSDLSFGAKYEL